MSPSFWLQSFVNWLQLLGRTLRVVVKWWDCGVMIESFVDWRRNSSDDDLGSFRPSAVVSHLLIISTTVTLLMAYHTPLQMCKGIDLCWKHGYRCHVIIGTTQYLNGHRNYNVSFTPPKAVRILECCTKFLSSWRLMFKNFLKGKNNFNLLCWRSLLYTLPFKYDFKSGEEDNYIKYYKKLR